MISPNTFHTVNQAGSLSQRNAVRRFMGLEPLPGPLEHWERNDYVVVDASDPTVYGSDYKPQYLDGDSIKHEIVRQLRLEGAATRRYQRGLEEALRAKAKPKFKKPKAKPKKKKKKKRQRKRNTANGWMEKWKPPKWEPYRSPAKPYWTPERLKEANKSWEAFKIRDREEFGHLYAQTTHEILQRLKKMRGAGIVPKHDTRADDEEHATMENEPFDVERMSDCHHMHCHDPHCWPADEETLEQCWIAMGLAARHLPSQLSRVDRLE